jgi:hypothetical protein
MACVDETGLEKRHLVVEFETVDVERARRRADARERVAREQALVGEIVNGENRGYARASPMQIRRHQCRMPIVHMDEIGLPVRIDETLRQVGGGSSETAEANVIVLPIATFVVQIRRAIPVIELTR